MINVLALAIQKRLTASELYTLQIATHPLLTASPVGYQILQAAEDALAKLRAGGPEFPFHFLASFWESFTKETLPGKVSSKFVVLD